MTITVIIPIASAAASEAYIAFPLLDSLSGKQAVCIRAKISGKDVSLAKDGLLIASPAESSLVELMLSSRFGGACVAASPAENRCNIQALMPFLMLSTS